VDPSLQRLTTLMPPPLPPPAAPPWPQAPGELGFQLPQDYRDFVDLYGGGQIDEQLTVLAPSLHPPRPGDPGGFAGFLAYATDQIGSTFEEIRRHDPDDNPYPLYPDHGGLLAWGLTQDADYLFWLTDDADPDHWPVVVWLRQADVPQWRALGVGVGAFLLGLVDGTGEHAADLLGPAEGPRRWTRIQDWNGSEASD
jgi:hypothetical protein